MKGRFRKSLKQLTAGLLIMIISLLLVNRALYTHIHILPDGSMVSHAHPFSQSTNEKSGVDHQHSSLEFFLLDQLNVLTIGICVLFSLMAFDRALSFRALTGYHTLPSLIPIPPGRAPPVRM